MKLKELLDSIESTKGKTLPTAKALRNGSSPLVASKEFEDGYLNVYKNGFALYTSGNHFSVFRADYCGGYIYFNSDSQEMIIEEYFLEEEWWLRLIIEGEDRIVHNKNKSTEQYELEYNDEIESLTRSSVEDEVYFHETLKLIFSMMTQRQKEVFEMYYIQGLGVQEIANYYGITHQAVSVTLSDIWKKFKKNKHKFDEM